MNILDRLKYGLAYRLGGPDPIGIVPYRGFGSRNRVVIRGRVLEDQGIRPAGETDSIWRNLLNVYKRLESDEVPHATVRVRFAGEVHDVLADEEGHFDLTLDLATPLPPDTTWHVADLELLSPHSPKQTGPVTAQADVLVPAPGARFGVISDIDDTVVRTDVLHLARMARTLFLGNARTRQSFAGAAAFYRALQAGGNPLFYVSDGPVNLHDLLEEFLALQGFPERPVIFQLNWGLPTDRRRHKPAAIERLLETYPELPFLLIGDSGERDPELYADVVARHGARILAVFIRDVGRRRRLRELADQVSSHGSTLLVAESSRQMAAFATERGWL